MPQTAPGSLDALVADLGRDVESRSTIADVDHRVEELIDDLLAGDTTFDRDQPESLSWIDQRGLFDGLYSLQASQCLSCDAADGGLGFAQGGLPFLRGGGGSGGPAIGMRSTSGGGGASGSGGLPGGGPTAPDATLEFRPVTDGDDFTVEPVLDTEGGPNPGGDAPWSAPPLTFTEPNTPVDPTPVPEPATLVLTGLGIAGLVARNRGAGKRRAE